MKLKIILAFAALLSLASLATTWGAWNGITVGGVTGNISKWNGTTIGTTAGNIGGWNGMSSPAGISWTVVHHTVAMDHGAGCAGLASCAITIPATAAGSKLVEMVHVFNTGSANTAYSSMTGGGGSWVNDTTCQTRTTSGTFTQNFCIYNLTPTTGTTSLTVNLTSPGSTQWAISSWELSCTGTVAYDVGASSGGTAESCTSSHCAGVSATLAGAKDTIIQSVQPQGNAITAITGGAGYTTYQDFFPNYGSGFAAAINVGSGSTAAPTWTDASPTDTALANAIALKCN